MRVISGFETDPRRVAARSDSFA